MTTQRFSLEGKTALVIGGTSGIGRQIALGFAECGARVLPASRTRERVEETVRELREAGAEASGYVLDATSLEQLDSTVERVIADHGAIDILLNSQGTTVLKPAVDLTEEEYDRVIDTNLKSVFLATTRVGRHMIERGSGSIISIASLAGYRGWKLATPYAMSKFGVVGMTESLASEWAPHGVRVNGIAPGFFMTELNASKMSPERKQSALDRTPLHRWGRLEELVGAAIYLASDAASFVTGETIRVDGGYLAMGI